MDSEDRVTRRSTSRRGVSPNLRFELPATYAPANFWLQGPKGPFVRGDGTAGARFQQTAVFQPPVPEQQTKKTSIWPFQFCLFAGNRNHSFHTIPNNLRPIRCPWRRLRLSYSRACKPEVNYRKCNYGKLLGFTGCRNLRLVVD